MGMWVSRTQPNIGLYGREEITTFLMLSWTPPSLGLLPDCWEQPAPSSAIPYHLPAVRTGGCSHTPPACPSLEQPTSCSFCSPHSSPSQYASSPLDVLPFPCLLQSRRAQSWPGEALPLPRSSLTTAQEKRCSLPTAPCFAQGHIPLLLVYRAIRLTREKALTATAWHWQELGMLDPQLCQALCPCPASCQCAQFCSWCAAMLCQLACKLLSDTMVLSSVLAKPVFCFFVA